MKNNSPPVVSRQLLTVTPENETHSTKQALPQWSLELAVAWEFSDEVKGSLQHIPGECLKKKKSF